MQLVRAFLAGEDRLFQARLGVALAVAPNALGLLLGAPDRLGGDAPAVGDPVEQHRASCQEAERDVDDGDEPEVTHLGYRSVPVCTCK